MLGFVVLVHGRLIGDLFKICGSTSLVSAQQSSKMVPFSGYRHVPSKMVLPTSANSPLFVDHLKVQFCDHLTGHGSFFPIGKNLHLIANFGLAGHRG